MTSRQNSTPLPKLLFFKVSLFSADLEEKNWQNNCNTNRWQRPLSQERASGDSGDLHKQSVLFHLLSPQIFWWFVLWKCQQYCPGSPFQERSTWRSTRKCHLPFTQKYCGDLQLTHLKKDVFYNIDYEMITLQSGVLQAIELGWVSAFTCTTGQYCFQS